MKHLFHDEFELLDTIVTGVDADTGDDLVDETPGRTGRCYFERQSSDETNVDRTQASQTAMAIFPAGTSLDEASRVQIRGDVWSVVGPPDRVHRRGAEHHVEAQLRLVT